MSGWAKNIFDIRFTLDLKKFEAFVDEVLGEEIPVALIFVYILRKDINT